MTDDKTRQLENRIDKLESTIEKMMPSRRDALKMGGAALVGGAAMSGTASAGTNQVGTIGSASQPVDLESEDINNADTISTQNIDVSQNVNGADTSAASNGEALTSDGSGGLAFATVGGGIPPNFSYQDVTNSRSLDTIFTNTTGKAILVDCHVFSNSVGGGEISVRGFIDGIFAFNNDRRDMREFDRIPVSLLVPNGVDYQVDTSGNGNPELGRWVEAEL